MMDVTTLLLLSLFTDVETEIITKALFDLSPVFIDKSNDYGRAKKEMLKGLKIDELLWRFEIVNSDSFTIDPTISQLIEQIKRENVFLDETPLIESFCKEESNNSQSTIIKVETLYASEATNSISPAWRGASALMCPRNSYGFRLVAVIKQLKEFDLTTDKLGSFESLQKHNSKLAQALKHFNEGERAGLYSILYLNSEYDVEQVKQLIKNKITPIDSDFYYLIRQLPFEQQKELLMEHQYNLSQFNSFDFSIIINAFMLGTEQSNGELIPFLIEQGFPLKQTESSPDPLFF